MVNAYINYYACNDKVHAAEIDTAISMNLAHPFIDKIYILKEPETFFPVHEKVVFVNCSERPVFREYFNAIPDTCSAHDVNLILNSDCFIDEKAISQLIAMPETDAYCLSRYEIKSARPLKIAFWKTRKYHKKHAGDSQDCWIFKGKPKAMWLDFQMGRPGCDNRLAYEFQNAGYRIVNPYNDIRVYHLHKNDLRAHGATDRVPQPYSFPTIVKLWFFIAHFYAFHLWEKYFNIH